MLYKGIPPVSDHSWLKNSRERLAFLAEPKSWRVLNTWGRLGATYMRHALAWLEEQGEAKSFTREGVCYWVRVGRPTTTATT